MSDHRLRELAALFGKLGAIAFGGPAAHVAMMEDEVVRRRGWMTRERFLDLYGATNLIPGPNSTEMAIHIGHARAGWAGLVVAGACFIVPAAAIVAVIAWAYVRFGKLPQIGGVLYGIKPVIIAIVVQALWGLGRTAVKTWWLGAVALLAAAAAVAGVHELAILAGAGVLVACGRGVAKARAAFLPIVAGTAPAAASFSLAGLFLVFLKIGAILFGSGYVLLAFLRADLVDRLHWLTESQLLDAIAVGQITPGPVFTTATFIGYLLGGGAGAVIATVAIFLPAFVFVAISGPLVPRLRASPIAGAVLDGVNVASLALMAVVTVQLGHAAVLDPPTAALAITSAIVLLRFRISSVWLVAAGTAAGLVLSCGHSEPHADAPTCAAGPAGETGSGTYYAADGTGNCSFDASPNDLMVAAMNAADYNTAAWCGACLDVASGSNHVVVRVVDQCPGCAHGDLDLSEQAFAALAPLPQGRIPITWHEVPCPVTTPISYRFKEGSNAFWTAIQIRDHRYAITKLEVQQGSAWTPIQRADYNYFVAAAGLGAGPYTLRVTDDRGQTLVDQNIALGDAVLRPGTAQFATCP